MTKKVLFYEDYEEIEEISFDEGQRYISWYERLIEKENEFCFDRREGIEGIEGANLMENGGPIIRCAVENESALTMSELKEWLLIRGYEFRHKQGNEETEQFYAKIIYMQDRWGKNMYYVFFNIDLSIHYYVRDEKFMTQKDLISYKEER